MNPLCAVDILYCAINDEPTPTPTPIRLVCNQSGNTLECQPQSPPARDYGNSEANWLLGPLALLVGLLAFRVGMRIIRGFVQ